MNRGKQLCGYEFKFCAYNTGTQSLRYPIKNSAKALFFIPKGFGTGLLKRQGVFPSYGAVRPALRARLPTACAEKQGFVLTHHVFLDYTSGSLALARRTGVNPHFGVGQLAALKTRQARFYTSRLPQVLSARATRMLHFRSHPFGAFRPLGAVGHGIKLCEH